MIRTKSSIFPLSHPRTGGHKRPAFTLIEWVSVIAVMAILAMIAVPRFANFNVVQRVNAAARRISADLSLAQRRARFTGTNSRVVFSVPSNTYTLVGMNHLDHANQPYVVAIGDEPYEATIVLANFGGDTEVVFDAYGRPDTAGTVVIRVGSHQRTVNVDSDTARIRFVPLVSE